MYVAVYFLQYIACVQSLNMSTEAVRDFIYEVAMLLTIMMEVSYFYTISNLSLFQAV